MKARPFKQVDVFTTTPYRGNPLAVVLDGEGLSTKQMQDFTHWTNLSECTFLLPPTPAGRAAGAHYRVRIFCPGRELPFAGHPTLGSCHAWLEAQQASKVSAATNSSASNGDEERMPQLPSTIVQECGAGLVRIRRDGRRLAFAAPPLLKSGPLPEEDVVRIASSLGIARTDIVHHAWCDNGPNWRGVLLRSAEQVLALKPDAVLLAGMDLGVVGPWTHVKDEATGDTTGEATGGAPHAATDGDAPAFEIRAFFPGNSGLTEDPVTGSLNAAVAQWLIGAGLAPPRYVAAQGTAMDRAGRVHIEQDNEAIWVGGESITCVDGTVLL
jgi:PhzF family phenazine biosynthesis protein